MFTSLDTVKIWLDIWRILLMKMSEKYCWRMDLPNWEKMPWAPRPPNNSWNLRRSHKSLWKAVKDFGKNSKSQNLKLSTKNHTLELSSKFIQETVCLYWIHKRMLSNGSFSPTPEPQPLVSHGLLKPNKPWEKRPSDKRSRSKLNSLKSLTLKQVREKRLSQEHLFTRLSFCKTSTLLAIC